MRKNSKQIYKEILLEIELEKFLARIKLKECLDDFLNFKTNELEALLEACDLVKDNDILKDYINQKIIQHARNIMQVLGVTVEGFKIGIEELEEQKRRYGEIRNKVSKQILNKSEEVN